MAEPVVSKEAREILDGILAWSPSFKKEKVKERYLRILSLLTAEKGIKEAGKELMKEAIRLIDGSQYEFIFRMVEDPAQRKRLVIDPKSDLDAYLSLPIKVKRWDIPSGRPSKLPGDMKVLALNASPRVGGNTDILIDEALRGARDAGAASVGKITLQKIKMQYCLGCMKCQAVGWEGLCIQKDDINKLFEKIAESDAIIIGFPIYIGRECSQLTTLVDRSYCLGRGEKLGTGKRSMVIGTWGYPFPDDFDHVIERILGMMSRTFGCEPVEALSACGFSGLLRGFDDKGKAMILRYPRELEKAYEAGKALLTGR